MPTTRLLKAADERLRGWGQRLRLWERELEVQQQRTELASKLVLEPREATAKIGRNERCPCGSRLKYRHCQGLASR